MRAFMLFRPARAKPFNVMTQLIEIPVRLVKPDSPSGLIFRWDYGSDDRRQYYPEEGGKFTNRGTAIIQSKLEMTLHYAFWMGSEYGISGAGGFHLNLWMDENEREVYKAYYVNARGEPCTDGEFWEIPVEVV